MRRYDHLIPSQSWPEEISFEEMKERQHRAEGRSGGEY